VRSGHPRVGLGLPKSSPGTPRQDRGPPKAGSGTSGLAQGPQGGPGDPQSGAGVPPSGLAAGVGGAGAEGAVSMAALGLPGSAEQSPDSAPNRAAILRRGRGAGGPPAAAFWGRLAPFRPPAGRTLTKPLGTRGTSGTGAPKPGLFGSKRGPRRGRVPNWGETGPKWGEMWPKWVKRGQNRVKRGQKWAETGPKMAKLA